MPTTIQLPVPTPDAGGTACDTCRWFARMTVGGRPTCRGDCRLHGPKVLIVKREFATVRETAWPSVEESDYCGEWEARPDGSLPPKSATLLRQELDALRERVRQDRATPLTVGPPPMPLVLPDPPGPTVRPIVCEDRP